LNYQLRIHGGFGRLCKNQEDLSYSYSSMLTNFPRIHYTHVAFDLIVAQTVSLINVHVQSPLLDLHMEGEIIEAYIFGSQPWLVPSLVGYLYNCWFILGSVQSNRTGEAGPVSWLQDAGLRTNRYGRRSRLFQSTTMASTTSTLTIRLRVPTVYSSRYFRR
jgi:hypothetical protein